MHERSQPPEPDPERVQELAEQFGVKPQNIPKTPRQIEHDEEMNRRAEQLAGLVCLRRPFKDEDIEILPRYAGYEKIKANRKRGKCAVCEQRHELPAIHLSYVGHATLTERLLSVDDFWTWEPLSYDPDGSPHLERDEEGNPIGLWGRVTVCGLSRIGYGSCEPDAREAVKELIGDLLRNACMRFGCALELWKKGDRDVQYVDETGASFSKGPSKATPAPVEHDESGDPVMLVCVACGESTPKQAGKVMAARMDSGKWDVKKGDPIYRCGDCGQWVPVREPDRTTDEPQGEEKDDLPF